MSRNPPQQPVQRRPLAWTAVLPLLLILGSALAGATAKGMLRALHRRYR